MVDLPVWALVAAIVGVILTTAFGVAGVIVAWRSRQRRAIACQFDPIVSPLEVKAGAALEGDIEIRYRGQPVENLFIVRAKLKNTGNVAIRKSHVVESITFRFPDAGPLRTPRTVERSPADLSHRWKTFPDPAIPPGGRVRPLVHTLEFELLNPGDELTVEFLCTGQTTLPQLTARIEGVTRIDQLDPELLKLRQGFRRSVALGGTIVAGGIIVSAAQLILGFSVEPVYALAALILSFLMMLGIAQALNYLTFRQERREQVVPSPPTRRQ